MHLVCLGYGYVAQAFTGIAGAATLTATGRSVEKTREKLGGEPAHVVAFDGKAASNELIDLLQTASHVLVSIPPDQQGCPAWRALGDHLGKSESLQWLGYLSATSVYGDRQGGWCFEWDSPAPTRPRGEARALAERQWLDAMSMAHIFRLPGIYGPGRSPLERVRSGSQHRWDKPGHVFNRIHVDDIATALLGSVVRPSAGPIFNVSDDQPVAQSDVVAEAHRVLGLSPPPLERFDPTALSDMAQEFWSENKRVSNALAKAALGWRLAYPTYREGLAACAAAMVNQDDANWRQ